MPLYEYVCDDCDQRFETLVRSFAAANDVACRSCESDNVRRTVSRVGMVAGLDEPLSMASSSPSTGCCGGSCGCSN
jgi:putative FmdB family regulatory protein